MTRGEVRATLLVVVLVAVAVIALWPRSGERPTGSDAPAGPAPTDPVALSSSRQAAALAPCPVSPGPRSPSESVAARGPVAPALAPLQLDCLGSPGTVDLGPALAGRTTLVNLWASWCGPCRDEVPALAAYGARPGAADVLGVDVADSPAAALALLHAVGARYPSVSDPDQVVGRAVGAVPVLPASVVVRADGRVVPVPASVLRTPEQVAFAVDTARAVAP